MVDLAPRTHLLVVSRHVGPGVGNLAKDLRVGESRVGLPELGAYGVLEFQVGGGRALGSVGVLDLLGLLLALALLAVSYIVIRVLL